MEKKNVQVEEVTTAERGHFDDRTQDFYSGKGRVNMVEGGLYYIPSQYLHMKSVTPFENASGQSISKVLALYMVQVDEQGNMLGIIEPSFGKLRARHYGEYVKGTTKTVEAIERMGIKVLPGTETSTPACPTRLNFTFEGKDAYLDMPNFVLKVDKVAQVWVPSWTIGEDNKGNAKNIMATKTINGASHIIFNTQVMALFSEAKIEKVPSMEDIKKWLPDAAAKSYFK